MSAKAIFLDRDDTIIEDPGYISRPEQVKLLPDVAHSLVAIKKMGYKLVVVSNQSGIARGMFTEEALEAVHNRLKELLAAEGAYLDQIYYCPFHPEGAIEKYRRDSDLRKPNPGMLLTAAEEMDIDLTQSWMVGNSYLDTTAGKRAGCRTILITAPGQTQQKLNEPNPDFKAANLREAVTIIQRFQKSPPPAPSALKYVPTTQPAIAPTAAPAKPAGKEIAPQPSPPHKQPAPADQPVAKASRTEELLEEVLHLLKISNREDLFADFSTARLIAGILQVIVIFCLLAAVYFMLNTPRNPMATLVSLGFATVFQLMSLTCYIMHGRK